MENEFNKLFVGGDLSGIQKFLYDITSKHASISLKGRSAYLSEYLTSVYKDLESAITSDGTECSQLYCSGGKFYFTTQNTTKVTDIINRIFREKEVQLWTQHKGMLGLNISYVAYKECNGKYYVMGHENEEETNSGILWKYCNANFARLKNQKFRNHILKHYSDFFEVQKVGAKPKICALTGIESSECRHITKADLKGIWPSSAEFQEVKDNEDDMGNEPIYLPSVIEQIIRGKSLSIEEHTKTFEEYATTDGGTLGDSYLGVLRMDIDGMGKRFIMGFPSLDAYRLFSQKVTNFFEGDKKKHIPSAINILLNKTTGNDQQSNKTYKAYLNIIYAGGDDLFIVGRWDKLIDFAKEIHDAVANPGEEFKTPEYYFEREYQDTTDKENPNKHISISGGITIVDPKFPIAKAAELAGDAEEAAKSYRKEKDSFNMFGKTITWDKEFDKVSKYKNDFVSIITKNNSSRSILHKMMLYNDISERNMMHPDNKDYSYIWHSAYFLKRYKSRHNFKEIDSLCDNLSKQLLNHRELQLISVAARWAELTLRTSNHNSNN